MNRWPSTAFQKQGQQHKGNGTKTASPVGERPLNFHDHIMIERRSNSSGDKIEIGTSASTAAVIGRIHRSGWPECRTGAGGAVKQTSGKQSLQRRLRGRYPKHERGARHPSAAPGRARRGG